MKKKKNIQKKLEAQKLEPRSLANKINSLQDPYPNAFIKCKDGSILFLTSSKYKSNSD